MNQHLLVQGFGNMVVTTCLLALAPFSRHGIGCLRNDRYLRHFLLYNAGTFITIYLRHSYVHQHQIQVFRMLVEKFDGLLSVFRADNFYIGSFQGFYNQAVV